MSPGPAHPALARVILAAACLGLCACGTPAIYEPVPGAPTPLASGSPTAAPGPGVARIPTRLRAPAAHIDAFVEPLGLLPTGELDTPRRPADAGWVQTGAAPGAPGTSVFVGLVDTASAPAAFSALATLKAGDAVQVTAGTGTVLNFRVSEIATYPYGRLPDSLFAASGPSRLALVDAFGPWDQARPDYTQRLVVYAVPA